MVAVRLLVFVFPPSLPVFLCLVWANLDLHGLGCATPVPYLRLDILVGLGLGLALVGGCCRCRCAGPVWVLACTFVTWSSCVSDGSAKTRWWLPTAVELISGTNCVVATRRTSSTMMSMVSTYGDLWRSSGELGRPRRRCRRCPKSTRQHQQQSAAHQHRRH